MSLWDHEGKRKIYVTTDRLLKADKQQQDWAHDKFFRPLIRLVFLLCKKKDKGKNEKRRIINSVCYIMLFWVKIRAYCHRFSYVSEAVFFPVRSDLLIFHTILLLESLKIFIGGSDVN